jgi:FHA domain
LRAGQAGDDEGLADLREGVIRASGFLLVPSSRPAAARAASHQQAQAARRETEAPERQALRVPEAVLLDADSPTVVDQVFTDTDTDTDITIADQQSPEGALLAERETIGVAAAGQVVASHTGAGVVSGVYCPRDHLNDPRDEFCRTCGLPLVPGAPEVEGPRPPLGKLTWDNGEVHELLGAALVGRDVGLDGLVVSGELAALVPSGQNDSMSRVHAELRPSGWDVIVIDRGSTNGTFIWDEASKAWQRLLPDEPHVVRPGAVLAFGERTATFETVAVPAG